MMFLVLVLKVAPRNTPKKDHGFNLTQISVANFLR